MLSWVNQKLALVRPGLQSNSIGDNPGVMVYALRFCLYLLVAGAGAFAFSVWLTPLRPVVNAVFAIVAAYLVIIVGRRRLGTKNL